MEEKNSESISVNVRRHLGTACFCKDVAGSQNLADFMCMLGAAAAAGDWPSSFLGEHLSPGVRVVPTLNPHLPSRCRLNWSTGSFAFDGICI